MVEYIYIYIIVELNIKIHLLNFATNGAPYMGLSIWEKLVSLDKKSSSGGKIS